MQRRAWLRAMALTPLYLPVLSLVAACDDKDKKDAEASGDGDEPSGKKKSKKAAEAEDGVIPAPKPGQVPTLKVGAWSKYRMGGGGEATWALVDRRNDTEWLIDVKIDHKMDMLIQAWVDVPDLRDLKNIKMVEAKAKLAGGPIQTITMGSNSPTAMMFSKMMGTIIQKKLEGLPQEDVKVEAGLFKGCYKSTNKQTLMGMTVEDTVWNHPAVPLPAMVKSEPKSGQGGFELIAYGDSGAKKSF